MVLSTSQQVALAFTGVLFMFVVLPRLYGFGSGTAAKDAKLDARHSRKGTNIQLVLGHSEVHFALVIARFGLISTFALRFTLYREGKKRVY